MFIKIYMLWYELKLILFLYKIMMPLFESVPQSSSVLESILSSIPLLKASSAT
jgi:hypothetical protein